MTTYWTQVNTSDDNLLDTWLLVMLTYWTHVITSDDNLLDTGQY